MPELPYLHSVKGHRRQRRGYGKSAAVLCIVMHSLNIPCECVCSTVFWAGGNVRDVLGGVHVGVRGGGRRHYR